MLLRFLSTVGPISPYINPSAPDPAVRVFLLSSGPPRAEAVYDLSVPLTVISVYGHWYGFPKQPCKAKVVMV